MRESGYAPIPAGLEVLIVVLEKEKAGVLEIAKHRIVMDGTHRVVYGTRWWGDALRAADLPIAPVDDPAGALGPGWRIKESYLGTVASAAVIHESDSTETVLYFLDETDSAYR